MAGSHQEGPCESYEGVWTPDGLKSNATWTAGGQDQPGASALLGGSCRIPGEPEGAQIYCSSFLSSGSLGFPDLSLWEPLGFIQSYLQMGTLRPRAGESLA